MKFVTHFATKNYDNLKKLLAPALLAGLTLLCAAPSDGAVDDDGHNATAITACGTVISQPGRYFLANDLQQCPGIGISITASYVEVALRGHTIQGTFAANAIDISGGDTGVTDVEIEGPGTVTGGISGVSFGNVHRSRVHNLVLVRNNFGMNVNAGDFSTPATVAATLSTDNEIRDNVIVSNNFHGISVNGGNQNRFINNNLSANGNNGLFLFAASNNIARHNTADVNGGAGIDTAIFGSGNLIDANTALGNGIDLNDENGDCTHNTWTNNSFASSSPACVQ